MKYIRSAYNHEKRLFGIGSQKSNRGAPLVSTQNIVSVNVLSRVLQSMSENNSYLVIGAHEVIVFKAPTILILSVTRTLQASPVEEQVKRG